MRHIGSLSDERIARRFGDYLLTQGIELTVEEGSAGWALWVNHDDHVDRARQELTEYLGNPEQTRYVAAERAAGRIRSDKDRRNRRLRRNYVDVRTSWARASVGALRLTYILIGISLIVYVVQFFASPISLNPLRITEVQFHPTRGLYYQLGLPEIRSGQVWRLVTPIFMHGNLLHLLFNMLLLRSLGGVIETRRGVGVLAGLVLSSAVFSNLLQYYWAGPLFLGMSGVVYALFGYAWMKGRYQPELQIGLTPEFIFMALTWLVVAMTGLLGPIANAAHVGGLIVGVIVGAAPYFLRKLRRFVSSRRV